MSEPYITLGCILQVRITKMWQWWKFCTASFVQWPKIVSRPNVWWIWSVTITFTNTWMRNPEFDHVLLPMLGLSLWAFSGSFRYSTEPYSPCISFMHLIMELVQKKYNWFELHLSSRQMINNQSRLHCFQLFTFLSVLKGNVGTFWSLRKCV